MTIEINKYGFTLDSQWLYTNLTWQLITLSVVGAIIVKVIRTKKGNN